MKVDSACGALVGLAVGDAFGTTMEFEPSKAPAFPARARGPQTEIAGGGPFGVVRGQVTDDTQMACCLFASIQAHGAFHIEDVGLRYVTWMASAFDIGNQTRSTLSAIRGGTPAITAGTAYWNTADRRPAGNGSLMRTAPIGVLLGDDAEACRRASLLDSVVTHADPRCTLACATFNAAIAAAVHRGVTAPGDLLVAAEGELPLAAAAAGSLGLEGDYTRATAELAADLRAARGDDPQLTGDIDMHRHAGYVRVAYRLAFWELLHADDYRDAVVDVGNRGGDADTNAAISGALAGAYYGRNGIPANWCDVVMNALPGTSALSAEYHPRVFDGLCDGTFTPRSAASGTPSPRS